MMCRPCPSSACCTTRNSSRWAAFRHSSRSVCPADHPRRSPDARPICRGRRIPAAGTPSMARSRHAGHERWSSGPRSRRTDGRATETYHNWTLQHRSLFGRTVSMPKSGGSRSSFILSGPVMQPYGSQRPHLQCVVRSHHLLLTSGPGSRCAAASTSRKVQAHPRCGP
jgi:hypothetical protein